MKIKMGFEVPYINSLIEKFWYVVLTNRGRSPNFSDILNLADSIISVDNPDNKESLAKLEYVRVNTHPRIEMNVASFELWLSRNWSSSINKELEFKDGKMIKLHEVVAITDEVTRNICRIVSEIAKKYTLQIKYDDSHGKSSTGQGFDMYDFGTVGR
jgi:hypothetical protein